MKHVIVIETVDKPMTADLKRQFENRVTMAAESMAAFLTEGPVFVNSAFFVKSAIAATHEMYNAPKWEGGEAA